jgi:hypothetical protein
MTADQTPTGPAGDEPGAAGRVEEVWTYAGRRESDGKRYYAWQDAHGQERYYAKVHAGTVGGKYILMVTRDGERVSVYPDPRYTGDRVDEDTRREMEALDIAAAAVLAAQAPRPQRRAPQGARGRRAAPRGDRREAALRPRTRRVPRLRHPTPRPTVVTLAHRATALASRHSTRHRSQGDP